MCGHTEYDSKSKTGIEGDSEDQMKIFNLAVCV